MKMKHHYTGVILAATLLLAACGKEKASDPNDASRFTIAIESTDNNGSKMYLDPTTLQLESFDNIWINGSGCMVNGNTLVGHVPAVPQGQYYLACPSWLVGLNTEIIPEGGIIDNANPAKTINRLYFPNFYNSGDYGPIPLAALVPHNATTLTFRHLCSYIKVRIKAMDGMTCVDSIVVFANNNYISGEGVITFYSNTGIRGIYNRSRLGKDRYVTLYTYGDDLSDSYKDFMIPVMSRTGTDFIGDPTHLTITVFGQDEEGNPRSVSKTSLNPTALERKKIYTALFTPGESGFDLGTGATYDDGGTVWNN